MAGDLRGTTDRDYFDKGLKDTLAVIASRRRSNLVIDVLEKLRNLGFINVRNFEIASSLRNAPRTDNLRVFPQKESD